MNIHIQGGRLIDASQGIDRICDLYIANGKVLAIGERPHNFESDHSIDASGKVVCPGLVDMQVCLREPGNSHKGTIASESAAAVAGGVTSLCCAPDITSVTDTTAVVELIRLKAEKAAKAHVYVIGALTKGLNGEEISAMQSLKEAGCVGVSNGHCPIKNSQVMRRAMEYARTMDMTLFLHAEDPWLSQGGCAHEGAVSTRMGLTGIPSCAEEVEVAKLLQLVEMTGTRVHFSQLSTAKAVRMISRAQFEGLPISADVAAHQLHLSHIDIAEFNSLCHVQPPLRSERDRDGLREGLREGVIGVICSDHQPHDKDAKLAPFAETEPGISALESLLPLALRLSDSGMSLMDIIGCLTTTPAKILDIAAGSLAEGCCADICIFDPEEYWVLSEQTMVSRGKNNPFMGRELKGRVHYTLLAGAVVYHLE